MANGQDNTTPTPNADSLYDFLKMGAASRRILGITGPDSPQPEPTEQSAPSGRTTPMTDADGNVVMVPSEKTNAELGRGYQYAHYMTDTEGNTVAVGHKDTAKALKKGYKLGPAFQQNLGKPPGQMPGEGQQYDPATGIPSGFTQPIPTDQDVSQLLDKLKTGASETGNIALSALKSSGPPLPTLPPGMTPEQQAKLPEWIKTATGTGIGPLAAGQGIGESMVKAGQQSIPQFQAGYRTGMKDPAMAALQYAQGGVSAASALDPFAAPSVAQMNELRAQGKDDEANVRGIVDALALGVGGKVQEAGLNKLANIINRPVDMPQVHETLSSLISNRAGKVDTFETAKSTAPLLRNEAAKQGINVKQFKGREGNELGLKLADDTVKSVETEFDKRAKPLLNDTTSGKPIADNIRAQITDALKTRSPETAARLNEFADRFDKATKLSEIIDQSAELNNELHSLYKKGTSEQISTDVETKAWEAAVEAARKVKYDYVGNKSGINPQELADLMTKERDLINVRNDFELQKNIASSDTSKAKAKSVPEKLGLVEGKVPLTGLPTRVVDLGLQKLLGWTPVDVLNHRFSNIFKKPGVYQPPTFGPAPGGVPPIGPNRLQLPPGQYPAGPSGFGSVIDALQAGRRPPQLPAGQYPGAPSPLGVGNQLALPASVTENIPLPKPPLEQPMQITPAVRLSGRDVETGQFKKFYGTSAQEAIQDQPTHLFPGILQRAWDAAKAKNTSPAVTAAIIKDLKNAMEVKLGTRGGGTPPPTAAPAAAPAPENIPPVSGGAAEVAAATSKFNTPEQVEALSKQAAQKLFNKPYDELNISERMAAIREATKVQTKLMQGQARTLPSDFRIRTEESVNGSSLSMKGLDGKEIGSVGLRDSDAIPDKQASEISDIQVREDMRQKGYGQALLEKAAEHAISNGDDFLVSSGSPTKAASDAWQRLQNAHPDEVKFEDGRWQWDLGKKKVVTTPVSNISAVHYSNEPGLTELDPSKFGANPHTAAEVKRAGAFPEQTKPLTYLGERGVYREPAITSKPSRYSAEIPKSSVYDLSKDPENLIPAAVQAARQGGFAGENAVLAHLEQLIRNKGYQGTIDQSGVIRSWGKVPVKFDPRKSVVFGSSNVKEGMSLVDAQKAVRSPEHQAFMDAGKDSATAYGLDADVKPALGSWSDGAEQSARVEMSQPAGMNPAEFRDRVRAIAAEMGKNGNQKYVAVFNEAEGGPDHLNTIEIPKGSKSAAEVAKILDDNGIKDRTIHDAGDSTVISLIDKGKQTPESTLDAVAKALGAKEIKTYEGQGEFNGAETREEAGRVFDNQISNAAQWRKTPLRQEQTAEGRNIGGGQEATKRFITDEQLAQARANLTDKMTRSNVGFDPTMLADAAVIGAHYIETGIRSFAKWSGRMIDEFGETIKPHLQRMWGELNKTSSSAPLLKNIVPQATTMADVAKSLETYRKSQGVAPLSSSAPEASRLSRAVAAGRPEVAYQMKQPESGADWYGRDIERADAAVQKVHPELKSKTQMTLFKAINAATSVGNDGPTAITNALDVYDIYKKTGEIPLSNPATKMEWPNGKFNVYKHAFSRLQDLISEKGEDGAAEWLNTKHPVSELKTWNKNVAGRADDMEYGAIALGPKVGAFHLNMSGIKDVLTADQWVARTWNRWMGGLNEEGVFHDRPRNTSERQLMKGAIEALGKEHGLSVADAQAVLWNYEQQMYTKQGVPSEQPSYGTAAENIVAKRMGSGEQPQGGASTQGGEAPIIPAGITSRQGAGTLGAKPKGFSRGVAGAQGGFARTDIPSALAEGVGKIADVFYSKMQKFVEEKMPNVMPVDMLLSSLKNAGIPQDEMKYSRLNEFLQGKNKVNKQELLDHLQQNGLQVETMIKGGRRIHLTDDTMNDIADRITQKLGQPEKRTTWLNIIGRASAGDANEMAMIESHKLPQRMMDELRAAYTSSRMTDTKYAKYQTPGGSNYREILLQLPTKGELLPYDQWLKTTSYDDTSAVREIYSRAQQKGYDIRDQFTGGHFDEPNVIAHMRVNDRFINDADGPSTQNGQKGYKDLHVEEFQSDWHQQGRQKGYQENIAELRKNVDDISAKMNAFLKEHGNDDLSGNNPLGAQYRVLYGQQEQAHFALDKAQRGVPDAPFKKDWHELAMKRIIRYAIENGYDRISWTTGETQNTRYDLSKHVDQISFEPANGWLSGIKDGQKIAEHYIGQDLSKLDSLIGKGPAEKLRERAIEYGRIREEAKNARNERASLNGQLFNLERERNQLSGYDPNMGWDVKNLPGGATLVQQWKDLSDKIDIAENDLNSKVDKLNTVPRPNIRGKDLQVGGSGMKGFYDKILVDFMNKYGKKWGAKVEESHIDTGEKQDAYVAWDKDGKRLIHRDATGASIYFPTLEAARKAAGEAKGTWSQTLMDKETPVHSIDVTPAMKKEVMQKGQPISEQKMPTSIPPKIRELMGETA